MPPINTYYLGPNQLIDLSQHQLISLASVCPLTHWRETQTTHNWFRNAGTFFLQLAQPHTWEGPFSWRQIIFTIALYQRYQISSGAGNLLSKVSVMDQKCVFWVWCLCHSLWGSTTSHWSARQQNLHPNPLTHYDRQRSVTPWNGRSQKS